MADVRAGKELEETTWLIGIALLVAWCNPGLGADSVDGWMLVQEHAVNGKQVLYIAPHSLRIDNMNIGYTVIADSKTQTIDFFNDRRKLRYKAPLKSFNYELVKMVRSMLGDDPTAVQWKKVKDGSVGNLGVKCYEASDTSTTFSGSRNGGYLAGAKHVATVHFSLSVSKDILTTKEFSRLVAELEGTPDLGGIPIRQFCTFSDSAAVRTNLETTEGKHIAIDTTKWQVPTGYKQANKLSEIMSLEIPGVEDLLGN